MDNKKDIKRREDKKYRRAKPIKIAWIVLGILSVALWIFFVYVGFGALTSSEAAGYATFYLCAYFLPETVIFAVLIFIWWFVSKKHSGANVVFTVVIAVLSFWHLAETVVYLLWMSVEGINIMSLLPAVILLVFAAWIVLWAFLERNYRIYYNTPFTGARKSSHKGWDVLL